MVKLFSFWVLSLSFQVWGFGKKRGVGVSEMWRQDWTISFLYLLNALSWTTHGIQMLRIIHYTPNQWHQFLHLIAFYQGKSTINRFLVWQSKTPHRIDSAVILSKVHRASLLSLGHFDKFLKTGTPDCKGEHKRSPGAVTRAGNWPMSSLHSSPGPAAKGSLLGRSPLPSWRLSA